MTSGTQCDMTDDELKSGLQRRGALVVHFSHHANMRLGGVFPTDLQSAIANKDRWTLSCVVVWPDHRMDLPGSVGIILEPSSTSQIVSVKSEDAGSWEPPNGGDVSGGVPLSRESFDATFEVTGAYNEWRVKGAHVAGVFVARPNAIHAKKKQLLGSGHHAGEIIGATPIDIGEVFNAFPDLDVCTIDFDGRKL